MNTKIYNYKCYVYTVMLTTEICIRRNTGRLTIKEPLFQNNFRIPNTAYSNSVYQM